MTEITPLKELEFTTIAKIYDVASKIQEEIQLLSSSEIFIGMLYSSNLMIHYFGIARPVESSDKMELAKVRFVALRYLIKSGVVADYSICYDTNEGVISDFSGVCYTTVKIKRSDIHGLNEFLLKIKKIYKEKLRQENPEFCANKLKTKKQASMENKLFQMDTEKVIYKIKYTPSREILCNDIKLAKLNFNSENDNVFNYLFNNPNRKITKKEFKEKAGYAVGKSFHKIVENLGFTGDLRKAFFNVSEQAMFFRNPVTKNDLKNLGISKLKFNKKAII